MANDIHSTAIIDPGAELGDGIVVGPYCVIGAGVKRLSTMRTSEGGLAYWPGGYEANPFGTAYATLAIARARRLGIEAPAGMVDDMSEYMVHMLELDSLPHGYGVEVKAMLALALAELDALPPERADALLPVLAVAVRSLRRPERRAALAAVVTLVQTRPELADRIGQSLPELEIPPEPATGSAG